MIVIADTSPIHYLVLVGHVDVLQKLYKRVLIPGAVAMELQAASTPPAVKAWITAAPDWIEVRTVTHPDEPALTDLDPGEREAIVLAERVSADAVIIDDRAGRQGGKDIRFSLSAPTAPRSPNLKLLRSAGCGLSKRSAYPI